MSQRLLPPGGADTAERLRGIGLICLAVFLFTILDTCAKYSGRFVPALEVAWVRYAIALIFAVLVLRPWRNLAEYSFERPVVQIVRAISLMMSTVFNFLALLYLQLAEAVSIGFAAPIIVTALAGPILGEWAGPRRWAAVVAGFIGVMIILEPTPAHFRIEALFSVGAAISNAGYLLTTRLLAGKTSAPALLIFGTAISALFLTPVMPPIAVIPPHWTVMAALVITGAMGALGHYCLIVAHKKAPSIVLAPFAYTQIIWMVISGYLIFGDWPGSTTLIGGAIVIASGLYILYRESVRRN
jgi:drug/metabolite transporter (DMT)-like permease